MNLSAGLQTMKIIFILSFPLNEVETRKYCLRKLNSPGFMDVDSIQKLTYFDVSVRSSFNESVDRTKDFLVIE